MSTRIGLGSINNTNGNRDYWFGKRSNGKKICIYPESVDGSSLNITSGGVEFNPKIPSIKPNNNSMSALTDGYYEDPTGRMLLNLTQGIEFQIRWTESRWFANYSTLKAYAETEYNAEYYNLLIGSRTSLGIASVIRIIAVSYLNFESR